ncbi:MAG: sigma-54 dependent transcriptional regulator [Bacteroidota bacterium]
MTKQNYSILIIGDSSINQNACDILTPKYSHVHSYTDASKALEDVHSLRPDVILLDIFPVQTNALDVLVSLRDQGHAIPVIIMTTAADIKMAVRALPLGADDFTLKPLDSEQLELAMERAFQRSNLRRQVDLLEERLQQDQPSSILGDSEGMRKALQMAQIISRADDTTCLILGESGTGKELAAKYIHDNSARAKNAFITINCGAIPRDLAENEFFGYERGAFTGATEKIKQGRFEQAHRGTILLDEVGELSPEMQVKLLRVLQEKTFYRLGGSKEVHVDVRVLAATNRDLEKLIEEGKFREDLYYRLNVATIELPPLRERQDDVMLLSTAFIKEFNTKFGKQISGFTPEAAEIMQNYYWKGNVRELRNVIERVILLESQNVIGKESLSFLRPAPPQQQNQATPELQPGQHYLTISKSGAPMANITRDLILQTLKITDNDLAKAAKILAMSVTKLQYRMEQLNIANAGKLAG